MSLLTNKAKVKEQMYRFFKRLKSHILKVGINVKKKFSFHLISTIEERSRTLESIANTSHKRLETLETLIDVVEKRTQTLEFLLNQCTHILNFQTEQHQKLYTELFSYDDNPFKNSTFNFTKAIQLKTNFPIAINSNDHLMPDSTMEGLSRPTLFVNHCIGILGFNIKVLDIGTGAAGLVYEWAINGVLAAGIDGSDFCRKNKIGYWPLLPNNLLTCDITQPFEFTDKNTSLPVNFNLITCWEVLEHIHESDLATLLHNVRSHLSDTGYFIGSISLLTYNDKVGNPYHITLKPRVWWSSVFKNNGLEMLDKHPFTEAYFCRGNGPRFQDVHNYQLHPEDGFLFVARKIN